MRSAPGRMAHRAAGFVVLAVSAIALAACSETTTASNDQPRRSTTEYFPESVYGVSASPRVSQQASNLPRGGGRDQTGRPYQIRGQWYHPREDPDYRSTGLASWYGDAFHGRLTANGEIYDMTHLTAAHPTMPLPSYARVTNRNNGSSLIVRVNDRGPFHRGRTIDLSRRAAELLDFTHVGVARVDVEYLGRAPLHGQDDQYLMASYRPAGAPDPASDGLPSGVMIAMNGTTPTGASTAAFPGQLTNSSAPAAAGPAANGLAIELPETGPVPPPRPSIDLAMVKEAPSALLTAYAHERVSAASGAVSALAEGRLDEQAIVAAWSPSEPVAAAGEFIAVGSFDSRAEARHTEAALAHLGRMEIESIEGGGVSLTLHPDGRFGVDEMLRTAWQAGLSDAMTVRAD